jgi:iron-sulfur cluster repair protein YtfE (RIC family)
MRKPLKRHEALQPISREHHHGLLLSWKIREGFKFEVAPERIKKYTDWFWKNHLKSHFGFEEEFVFPLLGNDSNLIKRALREHVRLKKLFSTSDKLEINLSLIEEELVAHIRFEERILFQEVQKIASEEQLEIIKNEHSKNMAEEWVDEFWIKKES